MYCDSCGAKAEGGQNFCSVCGKGLSAAAAPRGQITSAGRVASHLHLLAVLWLVRAVLNLIPALFVGAFRHWGWPVQVPPEFRSMLNLVMGGIGWLLLLRVVACAVAAWGLFDREPWARLYTIIVSALSLIEFPVGTILGIYSLWVLLPESSATEYRQLAMS